MSAIGKELARLAARIVRVASGTVVSDDTSTGATLVTLDSGPGVTVAARSMAGTLPAGARVLCLVYPPRGLLVLGPMDAPSMHELGYAGTGTPVTTTATGFAPDNTDGPNGTFPYPPTGRIAVTFSADMDNSAAFIALMTIRVRDTDATGTIRYTGSGTDHLIHEGTAGRTTSSTTAIITGLPTSGTGYVEGLYRSTDAGNTSTFRTPTIVVRPSP